MNVNEAIAAAEAILPVKEAAEGEKDPHWQAIIAISDFVETDPEPVWLFVERWASIPTMIYGRRLPRAFWSTCLSITSI